MKKKKTMTYIIVGIILLIISNLSVNYHSLLQIFYHSGEKVYENIEPKKGSYEINNINKRISVIKIDFETIPQSLQIKYQAKNFRNYSRFNSTYYKESVKKKTIYVYLSINEKITDIKISPFKGEIKRITLNPIVKYQLKIIPTLTIFILMIPLIYICRENRRINFKDPYHVSSLIFIIITISYLFLIYALNYGSLYQKNKTEGTKALYNELYTDAIINHTLKLNYPVSEGLSKTTDPYDTSNRSYKYLWDASYYKNNYYCYFGIWPNLVLYTPYKLITGNYLPIWVGGIIYSILGAIVILLILKEIVKRYFSNISYRSFVATFIYIVFGSKLLWCMHRPDFYEVIIMAAFFHVLIGLYLVLFKDERKYNIIGYSSLAIAVLCRPTALFASILILPKIINRIKNKNFSIKDFILLALPYMIVGIFTMYINYIRFGNIFEFGLNYQLTTINLRINNLTFLKAICGIFYYLFNPYKINFLPLTITSDIITYPIMTDYYIENLGGGVIWTSILGILFIIFPYIYKRITQKELKVYLLLCPILSILLMIISSSVSLIGRYMLDFNYLIYFSIVIMALYMVKIYKGKILKKIYLIAIIMSSIINFFISLTNI